MDDITRALVIKRLTRDVPDDIRRKARANVLRHLEEIGERILKSRVLQDNKRR